MIRSSNLYTRRYRSLMDLGAWLMIPLVLVLLILGVIGCRAVYQGTETITQTVVLDKERVCDSDGNGGVDCKYLIFTEDGTFKLVDSSGLLSGKIRFSSSDVYGRIQVGRPATIRSMGWRIPIFSEYPNIIEIEQRG